MVLLKGSGVQAAEGKLSAIALSYGSACCGTGPQAKCVQCFGDAVSAPHVTNRFLLGSEARSVPWDSYLVTINLAKNLWLKDHGPYEEIYTDVFLNKHVVKLPSKHFCLYPQANAALSLGRTSLF